MSIRGAVVEPWNQELVWPYPSTRVTTTVSDGANVLGTNSTACLQTWTLPYLTSTQVTAQKLEICLGPPLDIVEVFYSKNGVPIDEDKSYDYANRYQVAVAGEDQPFYVRPGFRTAILNLDREPRFYGNLGFDGNYWFGNGRTRDVGMGTEAETSYLIRAKRGETSGKLTGIRHSRSGYFSKKGSHYNTEGTSTNIVVTEYTYPVIRLADLYLLYAEALNESLSVPNGEVYEYIDRVRTRAGLKGVIESWAAHSSVPQKPSTQLGMREIIHQERLIELAFEGKRFYDLRRWKQAHIVYNRNEYGWNVDASDENYYLPVVLERLTYTMKQYLWPISEAELRRNGNLVQNPFWND